MKITTFTSTDFKVVVDLPEVLSVYLDMGKFPGK
jgi:hypothetical protein